MDTTQNTQEPRPFGYWLTAVDRLMAAEFAAAFEREGASRRDWRLLNVIDGTAPAHRPLRPRMLRDLVERGWVARDGDGWTLTDEGRAAKERLGDLAAGIRATVTDAVSPEDYDTTVATLEKIATALGWEDGTPLPRRRGHGGRGHGGRGHGGHGHGHRHHGRGGRGFGEHSRHDAGHGFGEHGVHGHDAPGFGRHGFGGHGFGGHGFGGRPFGDAAMPAGHGMPGPERECRHPHRDDRGHGHGPRFERAHSGHGHRAARAAQHAYERGFDAGYSRGRDA